MFSLVLYKFSESNQVSNRTHKKLHWFFFFFFFLNIPVQKANKQKRLIKKRENELNINQNLV